MSDILKTNISNFSYTIKELTTLAESIKENFARRIVELHPGDIIYINKTEYMPLLNLGDIYDFQAGTKIALSFETANPAQGYVIRLTKNPPFKKWYQFWIKQQVVGYEIQIL